MKRNREFALVVAGVLGLVAPAAAQLPATITASSPSSTVPQTVQTELVEWDITSMTDIVPGALSVDDRSSSNNSKVWFVTRAGETRLYRLTPGLNMKHDRAAARSWDLGAQLTGGVRVRHSDDGRWAFVNVDKSGSLLDGPGGAVVAVDTSNNTRVTWANRPVSDKISDVAVDAREGNASVYTAAPFYDATDFPGFAGVVERLKPGNAQLKSGKWVVPAQVTRYPVGGGAGTCDDTGAGAPCIPGIAVDRRRGAPIFVSEPAFTFVNGSKGAIAEIDPKSVSCPTQPSATCVRVRHWPLPAGTSGPREIRIDDTGKLWGITSSGHLFSIEILKNGDSARVTVHNPQGPIDPEDLFAVSPNGGVIGFTDSNNNEVSVLVPDRNSTPINATVTYIKPITRTIDGQRESLAPMDHVVEPRMASAMGSAYRNPNDGSYVETNISTAVSTSTFGSPNPSFTPTGMAADGNWKSGAFFYGVTFADGSNRIGHLAVKIGRDKDIDNRRGDHDFDHDGKKDEDDDDVDDDGISNASDMDNDNDGIADVMDDDKNDDGIEDTYQAPGHRETKRSDAVSMLAVIEATTVTAPLSIEILNDDGLVVLSTPAALGKAVATAVPALPGVYTVRVKNAGLTPVTYKTSIVTAQIPY
jgi:hypothetical protein